jgi:hypothetical protein
VSLFYLIPLGLVVLFIYLQIGRAIATVSWNYWHGQFRETGFYAWDRSRWRARPKGRLELFAVFLLYPVTVALEKGDDAPAIGDFMFSKKSGDEAPTMEARRRSYLLCSSSLWPLRIAWTLGVTAFLFLRMCALGIISGVKYMVLARVERLPVLTARRLWAMRPRRAARVTTPPADENLVALVDEHRTLDERIIPLQARRREIESHPDFEKARALRARR